MAQAQAFETDFWKDANLRKVWDDIVPGEPRKTIPYTLTSKRSNFTANRSAKIIRSISTKPTPKPPAMAA